MKRLFLLFSAIAVTATAIHAQLAKDIPCKFLGNITTATNWQEYCDVSDCNLKFTDYWNQVTCENATKWGSVHQANGTFSWSNADRTANYCKENGILFKFHALIWGNQHPSWIEGKSVDETKKAIIAWYDEVKKHYPDLKIIDVVNEAIYSGGNYHSDYKPTNIIEALGSLAEDRAQKETGTRPSYNCNKNGYPNTNSYQWIAEAFRLAEERWPDAILIYNDYNTFQWQKTEYINLVNALKQLKAPIDAIGCQSHDLNDMGGAQFKAALEDIHNKTQMPIYITEYDIAQASDATQKTRYEEQFPTMWEVDYVAGVTLWGWINGKTWIDNTGIVNNCQKRAAFTWLENYMKSDKAKNVQSPICIGGGTSGISVSIDLSEEKAEVGDTVTISVVLPDGATNISDTYIIDFSINGTSIGTNYTTNSRKYAVTETGEFEVSVKVMDTSSKVVGSAKAKFIGCNATEPFVSPIPNIPGIIEAENFDRGCPEVSYYDTDSKDEGDANYRDDETGVDVVSAGSGTAIGFTAKGEWLNYTVNIKEKGSYTIKATVASGSTTSAFSVNVGSNKASFSVPQTADNSWDTYEEITKPIKIDQTGEQVIKITIDASYCNIDKLEFVCNDCDPNNVELVETGFEPGTYDVYSTIGLLIGQVNIESPAELNSQLFNLTGHAGVYLIRNEKTAKLQLVKQE